MKKRKITDNIPLKIMSVAVAVVLWLIVVNIDNPTGTNYYTINGTDQQRICGIFRYDRKDVYAGAESGFD